MRVDQREQRRHAVRKREAVTEIRRFCEIVLEMIAGPVVAIADACEIGLEPEFERDRARW
jgi:nitrogen fixation/metabolism regulation signal transduction histidine kinase